MKDMRPILNSLPAFMESARLESFTKAGEKLGMAQPSVSRFIHNLEASTGLSLFRRNHNQIELTKNGKALFDAVTLGLDHISGTISALREDTENSVMTIGCSHGFSHMWLQARMTKIQKALPQHKVQIVTTDHTVSLTQEDVSCSVRLGDGAWPDCVSKYLFAEEVFPVCTQEFAIRHNLWDVKFLTPDRLLKLPLVVLDAGKYDWLGWHEWFSYHRITYQIPSDAELINNYAFSLQAAMAGQGIALMWEGLDAPYLERGWLVELGALRVKTKNAYYLTFPKNSPFAENLDKAFN